MKVKMSDETMDKNSCTNFTDKEMGCEWVDEGRVWEAKTVLSREV